MAGGPGGLRGGLRTCRVRLTEGAGAERGAEQVADEAAVGGVEGADGRRPEAGLDGLAAAAGPAGLDRDPQVTGIAALELGDDRRPDGQPPAEDLHGCLAERARAVRELDARLAVQVQGLDF